MLELTLGTVKSPAGLGPAGAAGQAAVLEGTISRPPGV